GSRAASNAAPRSPSRSGTAPTSSRAWATCSAACRAGATSSSSRFSRTRTSTACSRRSRPSGTRWSRRGPRTRGRWGPRSWCYARRRSSLPQRWSAVRRRPSHAGGSWPDRTAQSWSRARSTCLPTSPPVARRRTMPRIAVSHLSSLVYAGGLHNFFNSGTWMVIRNLALLLVVIFWAATAYWVYKDARRRIEDPWLVVMSTLLGVVAPFLGPLVDTPSTLELPPLPTPRRERRRAE